MNKKRSNFIKWEEYFIAVAKITAERSKDPSTQVGAVIVNDKFKTIISTGYNGFPRGVDDGEFPWNRDEENWLDNKYPYIAHAELNAVVSAHVDLIDHHLYVNLFPCNECTKIIIQSGIKKIYYLEDKYQDSANVQASKRLLDAVGISYIKLPNLKLEIIKE